MLRSLLVFFLFATLFPRVVAQNFAIGSTVITFVDPSRGNRQIQTDIYYPATLAGANRPVATGQFPVVVFGHGFTMPTSAYANVWSTLVPSGVIVALPRTEGGFLPNHTNFARDLAYVITGMVQQNGLSTSRFFNRVRMRFAVGGHSMGGGAALLAPQYNSAVNAVFGLAPAETNPSAIAASGAITAPALLFTGSYDCVTPAASNGLAMYNALGSSCKTYVSVTGGSHCQFAAYNFNCSFGEGSSGCGNPPITRATQQNRVTGLLRPWLLYLLRGQCSQWQTFQNTLVGGVGFTWQQSCGAVPPCGAAAPLAGPTDLLQLYPVPTTDVLNIKLGEAPTEGAALRLTVVDGLGRVQARLDRPETYSHDQLSIAVDHLSAGLYYLVAEWGDVRWQGTFIKQ